MRRLPVLSVFTMVMTVPQACLWFVDGLRKREKSIDVACVGWVLLRA